jgi:eukaryotic-like serine/threonine-protein kinase
VLPVPYGAQVTDEGLLAGRYRLERVVGRGGMADVHAAHDEVLDRPVAVKLLAPRFLDDAQFIDRFRREAQAAASLNHPNIVAVFDTGTHEGRPFIVMELVRGRSLQQAIAAGGLTEDRALEVCAEVCSALQFAHQRGLVHRDVKPGNILLADDGTVKVTDFGIARAIDADTVTQTAAVLGTAAYLSPEQAQGLPVDARSDIYSLGVVLYEVLTGAQPFQGDSAVTVAYQHVQELPRPPRDFDPSISSAAEAIAVRAMAKNPANRYADADAMRDDLLRARVGQDVSAPAVLRAEDTALLELDDVASTRVTAERTDQRRRRVLGFVLLGLLSIAAAVAAVWYLGTLLAGDEERRVEVPNVVGRPLEEAERTLETFGLQATTEAQVHDDTIPAGSVVSQVPGGNQLVAPDTVVRLTISRGPELVAVPEVTDMTLDEARRALRAAGFVPGSVSREPSDDVAEDVVLRTEPPAGTELPAGREVALVVSSGQELARVPSVIGLSVSDARFRLTDRGFEVLVLQEFSDTVSEGLVIEQDPEASTELRLGEEVTIVVSRGPQEPSPEPTEEPSPTEEPTEEPSPTESPTDEPTDDDGEEP